MILKKVAIFVIASILSVNLIAAEEVASEIKSADKCEAAYSQCLTVCDSSGESNVEKCYDKCDEIYSACLENAQEK